VTRGIVFVLTTCLALVGAEYGTRAIDGYRFTSLRLAASEPWAKNNRGRLESRKWLTAEDAWPYVQQLPVAAGVEREWFLAPVPAPPPAKPDPDLQARADRYRPVDLPSNYEWNWKFAISTSCLTEHHDGGEILDTFDDVFVFDPIDGTPFPRFRFLRGVNYPSGLRTNAFGWRGPDVALNKRPGSVRLAFIGSSTTVGPHHEPYSYPELVQFLLNLWGRARHRDVTFEVINAGREGVNSNSLQAIVRQEVMPLDPDLAVYYEGSNQFWPANFIGIALPPRTQSGPSPSVAAQYLAIVRRLETVVRRAAVPGVEPRKPTIPVGWPKDLDERDPNLAHPQLPINLPNILTDLETIRRALDDEGAHLVVSSFLWLASPGMILDPVRDAFLFDYLNVQYWPFSYAHIQRYADFQNQVFRKYAAAHGLDFIDFAGEYPRDPRLFSDAVHMMGVGIPLQAWIVFNHLVPIIERHLASGDWPRTPRQELSAHPAFGARRLVSMQTIRAACREARTGSDD
jgi:hypothetical protein